MATLPVESEAGCFAQCVDGDEPPSSSRRKTKGLRKFASPDAAFEEEALSKEINQLSVEERNQIAKEMCGVPDEKEETPEFIAACLKEMDACLAKISHAKRKDFDRAVFLKPSLQNDKNFKLMFLRSDDYNAKKAAERMASYFTCKRNLFGEDKLVKKITLDDLEEQDLQVVKPGNTALILSSPDRSGRPVIISDISKSNFHSNKSLHRFGFYHLMRLLENEAAQKTGIVVIVFCSSGEFISERLPTPAEVLATFKEKALLKNSLPLRISSFHYCYDSPVTNFFIPFIQASMGRSVRLRLRSHFGSATEIRYALRSFGIYTDGVIIDKGEEDHRPTLWQQYIEHRRKVEQQEQAELEAQETKSDMVPMANQNDVLLGTGRSYQQFPGNQRFRELLDDQKDRYKACDHLFEKTIVLQELIQTIHDAGGKFLKRTQSGWEIVKDETAKEKIRKYFRGVPRGGTSTVSSSRDDGDRAMPTSSSRSSKRLKVDQAVDQNMERS